MNDRSQKTKPTHEQFKCGKKCRLFCLYFPEITWLYLAFVMPIFVFSLFFWNHLKHFVVCLKLRIKLKMRFKQNRATLFKNRIVIYATWLRNKYLKWLEVNNNNYKSYLLDNFNRHNPSIITIRLSVNFSIRQNLNSIFEITKCRFSFIMCALNEENS